VVRISTRLPSLRKKSLNLEEIIPQQLKPDLFLITYVRAEARTLQSQSFSARCKVLPLAPGKRLFARLKPCFFCRVFRSFSDKGPSAYISNFPSISVPAILERAHPVRQFQPQ
jgi:hypothetical protein